MSRLALGFLAMIGGLGLAQAEELTVPMNLIDAEGVGKAIGSVKAEQTSHGLLLTPRLGGLTAGLHGFHVHEQPDCGVAEKEGKKVAGLAAGGHYDPTKTGRHEGPYGAGHIGDLPALYVDQEGKATLPVLAPRLKLADLKGRSLVIHAGGDNYSDQPEKLGGGGARVACSVVK